MNAVLPYFIEIGIGVVIIALVRYTFVREKGLLMSKEDHYAYCDRAKKEARDGIKEEFADFREYFKREVEIKVIESLRNLNGTLEEKIEKVVSRQIKPIEDKIDKRLDLVEVVKTLARKGD